MLCLQTVSPLCPPRSCRRQAPSERQGRQGLAHAETQGKVLTTFRVLSSVAPGKPAASSSCWPRRRVVGEGCPSDTFEHHLFQRVRTPLADASTDSASELVPVGRIVERTLASSSAFWRGFPASATDPSVSRSSLLHVGIGKGAVTVDRWSSPFLATRGGVPPALRRTRTADPENFVQTSTGAGPAKAGRPRLVSGAASVAWSPVFILFHCDRARGQFLSGFLASTATFFFLVAS